MRIAVLTVGSYGDVRPYVALARALVRRGHDAFLAGADHFAPHAEAAGVPYRPLGPYPDEEIREVIARLVAEPNELRHPALIVDGTRARTLSLGAEAIQATRDVDLVVTHNLNLVGTIAALVNRKPFVTGHLFPSLIPSSRTTPQGQYLGTLGNRLLWAVARQVARRTCDPAYNELFRAFGLPPRRDTMVEGGHSPLLNLVAISPSVVPRDPVWPERYRLTGYWVMDDDPVTADPVLESFLADGPPPVVVTFGSMVGVDPARRTAVVVDALARIGARAILQAGWAGLGDVPLPPSVFRADFVPHERLFPRAACVVHHGGAGTTAAVLRAGVPGVLVPHLGDQIFWSRHLARLGVSPGGVPRRNLAPGPLSALIGRCLEDRALGARCRKLGERLRAEDGLAAAVTAIESAA